ncbi:MAG: DUF4190 domain-containing protein [Clostridiaceae bacterium]|nr:DUF4190 domain-containing protein [Clostridiaceae bacterium]
MEKNIEEQVVKNSKVTGLSIAALVLGIISIVLWCAWFISIPCSILALIFGIIGIKKPGKGLAIAGLVTGAISLTIWLVLFMATFAVGFMEGLNGEEGIINKAKYASFATEMQKIKE